MYCLGEEAEDADMEAPKIYEPIPSLEHLAERLQSYMEQYNETIRGAKMDMVFFKVLLLIYHMFLLIKGLDS
jgi:dynein heavy chain